MEETRDRNIEAALRDSEERYRILYEENPSMYFTVDPRGAVLSVNPFGAARLGYTVADLVGKPVLSVFHPEDKQAVVRQLQVCVDKPGEAFTWELRKIRSDGQVMWVREVARAVRDRNDEVIVLIVCEDITSRRAAEGQLREARDELEGRVAERTSELEESQRELRRLAGRLLTAQEDERRRLAREIHDDTTQRLAAIALEIGRLERRVGPSGDEPARLTREIRAAVAQLATDVHAFSRRLHPSILEDLGLVEAIEAECEAFSQRGELDVRFHWSELPENIDKQTAMGLYRITQEALRNVAKHASTAQARVWLTFENGGIVLTVLDNGVGFDRAQGCGGGLGLVSIKERARLMGGDVQVESSPGAGCRVTVRVPCR